MPDNPFGLTRFVDAQAGVLDRALAELAAGRKRSHWMWFVFPQVAGLGSSPMAERYAIRSVAEARAYLAHPVLGPNLHRCVDAVLLHDPLDPSALMGWPDDLKLRSSMTLVGGHVLAVPAHFARAIVGVGRCAALALFCARFARARTPDLAPPSPGT